MSCTEARPFFESKLLTRNGKRSFTRNIEFSTDGKVHLMPCGKCTGCRARQSRDWGLRCLHEAKTQPSGQACFLTLTYANPAKTHDIRDMQLFHKKLRIRGFKYKYFQVGEAGDSHGRWHHHALLFGRDFLESSEQISGDRYFNPMLQDIWGHGMVQLSPATPERCFYAAGYCHKKLSRPEDHPAPVMSASSRPPIGHDFVMAHHESMNRLGYCVVAGQPLPIPSAYLARYPDLLAGAIQKRQEYVEENSDPIWTVDHEKSLALNLEAKFKLKRR